MLGLDVVVYSNTLRPTDYPDVTVINSDPIQHVQSLKVKPGQAIWLFGGGALFRTFLEAGVVDTVEPAVVPVLLGTGVAMLPATDVRTKLVLTKQRVYERSGTVLLEYSIHR
jgi:dihydrofolate reductase